MTENPLPPAPAPRPRRWGPRILTATVLALVVFLGGAATGIYLTRPGRPLASLTATIDRGLATPHTSAASGDSAGGKSATNSTSNSASGDPAGASNGTQLASYSFDLPAFSSAPLGITQPTRSDFNPAAGADIQYNGYAALFAGNGEQILDLGGNPPMYQACTADTHIEGQASPTAGTTFCIAETGHRIAGVTVASVGGTQGGGSYVTLNVTLWQNSQS